jgi:hypothetical protein
MKTRINDEKSASRQKALGMDKKIASRVIVNINIFGIGAKLN